MVYLYIKNGGFSNGYVSHNQRVMGKKRYGFLMVTVYGLWKSVIIGY